MKRLALLSSFCLFPLLAQRPELSKHYLGVQQPLTAPSSRPARDIALDHVRSLASELNLADLDLAGLYIVKEYDTAHNGVHHIIFNQRFQGINVLNAEWVVNIDSSGSVLNSGGNLYAAPPPDVFLPAQSSAMSAVRVAVRDVNPKLAERFLPFVSARPATKTNGVRFTAGPLPEEIDGELVWYAMRGQLHAAWLFYVVDEDGINSYATVVDDGSQSILSKLPMTYFQSPPKGLVFERESPQPNPTPGVRLTGPPPLVQRSTQPFTGDPTASPRGWVTGGETAGNNAIVGENRLGTAFLLTPITTKAPNGDFSFPLQLGVGVPNPINYPDAANTNLFYWINRAHDLHYLSGFDEAAGNYQQDNFNRGGAGGDPIYAYSHYGSAGLNSASIENAFFSTRNAADGSQGMVAMFLSASHAGDFFTDGSYDAVVMVHEYTHGVSFRLVRQGYTTFQGAAMGEAWSDFFGLEYTLPTGAPPDGFYALSEYFDQDWGSGDLRSRGYSTNMDLNPLTYANLGQVIPQPEVHADGEIWFEALWEVRANLIKQFGEAEGRRRVRLLVLDGMKLSVPAPSMIDMRDAILLADRVDFNGASQDQLWAGFAKRGMGALAYSLKGDSVHIVSSFDLPSAAGQFKFYDDPLVIGEPIRLILQDSTLTAPTVRAQVTAGSGDVENIVLVKTGSIYVGTLTTSANIGAKFNNVLSLVPGDAISAYYVHFGAPATKQITTKIGITAPYFFSSQPAAFTFANEQRLRLTGSVIRINLPFSFPFFSKKYSSAYVYRNGLIAFDSPVTFNACTDTPALSESVGIAPLWLNLITTGVAQPGEDVYVSAQPGSVTFRWAAETASIFSGGGSAVNFAATLFDSGRIQFSYGAGNHELASATTVSGCSPGPTVGISNGHEVFTQTIVASSFDNLVVLRFDPPFGDGVASIATVESPSAGQHFQDILQVTGIAYDPVASVSRIDIFVDGIAVARTTPNVARADFCRTFVPGCPNVGFSVPLNVAALGLSTGQHTLKIRVTNTRGLPKEFPDTPISFFLDAGQARLPYGKIELPAAGATVSGTVTVRGYVADDDLRILSVDTLVDGVTYGPTTYGISRTDICNALTTKPPNCPAIGFQLGLATSGGFPPVPDGQHTLQIRARDETGRFTLIPDTPITFTVKNGAPAAILGGLDTPKTNDHLSGIVHMSGYAYSPGQRIVANVVAFDNYFGIGTARYGLPRPDICATLTNVPACPNIGFTFDLDTTTILNGPHTLGVLFVNDHNDQGFVPNLANGGINVIIDNH